jgi:hypothetical protein
VKRSKLRQILPSRRLSGLSRRLAARLARFQFGVGLMIARRFETPAKPAGGPDGEFEGAWATAAPPLVRKGGRTALLLDDLGGEPFDRLLSAPWSGRFLRVVLN